MARLILPVAVEDDLFTQKERAQATRQSFGPRITPRLAQGVGSLHRAYPYVPGGAKLSLAQGDRGIDDPVTVTVAQASQKRKAKRGFGWHSIGDAVSAGIGQVVKPLSWAAEPAGAVGRVVSSIGKPAVRTGFMALQAPFEEAQGLLRNVASGLPGRLGEFAAGVGGGAVAGGAFASLIPIPVVSTLAGAVVGGVVGGVGGLLSPEVEGKPQWAPQSQLGIAAGRVLTGQEVQTGSGFFTGHESPLAVAQRERAIKAAAITDKTGKIRQGWTIGRSVADVVTEPGTTPYNVLSGVVDSIPALRADPGAIALGKAGKLNAARKTVRPEIAAEFLAGKPGQVLKEALAGESNPFKISKLFGGQLDDHPEMLSALARETDPGRLDDLLRPVLGAQVKRDPTARALPAYLAGMEPRIRSSRIPRLTVSGEGLTRRQFVNVPKDELKWSSPREAIEKIDAWQALAKVPAEERLANNGAFIDALAGPNTGRLPALAATAKSVESAIKAKGASPEVARHMSTLFSQSVEDARWYSAMEIAEGTHVPAVAVAGDTIGLKSPHLVSEFLSSGVRLPDMKELTRTVRFANKVLNHPLVNRPLDSIDAVMGRWRAFAVLRAAYIPRVGGEGQARAAAAGYNSLLRHPADFIMRVVADAKNAPVLSLEGVPLKDMDAIQGGLNRIRGSSAFSGSFVSMKDRVRLTLADGPDKFFGGWADHELGHLAGDPIGRRVARLLLRGADEEGEALHTVDDLKESFYQGPLSRIRKDLQGMTDDEAFLADRATSDQYVDSVVERVRQFTRDDPDLLEVAWKGPGVAPRARTRAAMERLVAEDRAPRMVVGDRALAGDSRQKKLLDQVVDVSFDWIAAKPENFIGRSKVMGEGYWKAVERMLPALDETEKARALRFARDSKLAPDQLKRLQARAEVAFDGPRLAMADVNTIAGVEAAGEAKRLFYDISRRQQWSEASKLVFPFAEAWKEMLTTWSKLLVENPASVRRFGQVVEGARGSGFFHTDPATGEEMFTYPGSAFVSRLVTGAPVPIKGGVSGLNLFAQNPVLPGFGPAVQVAAGVLIPDKPEFDWVAEAISPFGRGDTSGGFLESFLPASVQKLRKFTTSGESDRVFNNTVYDMGRYLVSTGKYSIDTPEAQEETTQAAVSMAKRMYLLRAFGSFALPAAPQPQAIAEDKDGRVVTQFALIDEFRKLQDDPEVGYENAPQVFLERHGDDALLFMQPKSKGGGPPLEDTLDWMREHPDQVRRYGETYGFFAPTAGKFSMTAYERQLATGEREALTPREAQKLANHRVASMRFRTLKDAVGPKPTDTQRKWLKQVQDALIDEYHGYEPQKFDAAKIPRQIRELEDAVADPVMARTETGKAIKKYFTARQQAIAAAQGRNLVSFSRAKSARPIRDWLRAVADVLQREHPAFGEVWDVVLSHEMTADVEEPEPTAPEGVPA